MARRHAQREKKDAPRTVPPAVRPADLAYASTLCLSAIVGRLVAIHLAEREGMATKLMEGCCVCTLVFALVGARLLDVLANPGQFDRALDVFAWWKGGGVA